MRIHLLLRLAVSLTLLLVASRGDAAGYLTTIGSGADVIPVVVVKGSAFAMGHVQGTLLKKEIRPFLTHFLKLCQTAEPKRCSDQNLDAAWKAVAPYTDERFKEELRGLAAGSGLPIEMVRRVHMIPVVGDYACSSVAAWGDATRNGHLYQTRNLDWEMQLGAQDHPCVVVYLPNQGAAHASITFTGFIGCNTGINEHGIVLAEMGDSPGRDYPFDLQGEHFTAMFRHILTDATSLDQAIQIMRSTHRIKKYHFVVGDGHSKQAVKVLAHAPDMIVWKDNDPTDELAPEVLKNVVYQDEGRGAYAPLKEMYGRIDQESMIKICRKIPIKGGNLLDVVYDATAVEAWIAYAEKMDEAYKRPFVHFRLQDYLDYDRGAANAVTSER